MLHRCILTLAVLAIFCGCKSPNAASDLRMAEPMDTVSPTDQTLIGGIDDPYTDGFVLRAKRPEPGQLWGPSEWPFAYHDAQGTMMTGSPAFQSTDTAFALDQGLTPEGEVIFTWPKSDEVIERDYERLGELMREYSSLVGTCLSRPPEGEGEQTWLQWVRSDQHRKSNAQLANGTEAYCSEVVKQLIDRFVPQGSQYRQYGNCGEGGRIGACLAKRAGFADNEIRLCLSQNDHFFAMVREDGEDPERDWCILDRWDLIGHFQCGVNVNPSTQVVTLDGQDVSGQKWFEKVNCATFQEWAENPRFLY